MSRSRHPVRLFTKPPPAEIAARYLLWWNAGDVVANPGQFPPFTAQALFNRPDTLLELDAGCATGEFAIAMAVRTPHRCFIGFDRAAKPLYRAVDTAHRLKLDNIKFMKSDFRVFYPLLQPHSLGAVYYHFPSPYVKARHDRAGVFGTRFLDAVGPALAPGGFISIITDNRRTFDHFVRTAGDHGGFRVDTDGPFHLNLSGELKSFHHVKWEARGWDIFRMELQSV